MLKTDDEDGDVDLGGDEGLGASDGDENENL
jgi:hypothetical protein